MISFGRSGLPAAPGIPELPSSIQHFTVPPFFSPLNLPIYTKKQNKTHACAHQPAPRQMHICTQINAFTPCHRSLAVTLLQGLLVARTERQETLHRMLRGVERERIKEGRKGKEWDSPSCCQRAAAIALARSKECF